MNLEKPTNALFAALIYQPDRLADLIARVRLCAISRYERQHPAHAWPVGASLTVFERDSFLQCKMSKMARFTVLRKQM